MVVYWKPGLFCNASKSTNGWQLQRGLKHLGPFGTAYRVVFSDSFSCKLYQLVWKWAHGGKRCLEKWAVSKVNVCNETCSLEIGCGHAIVY
jgi:hypothetical protein